MYEDDKLCNTYGICLVSGKELMIYLICVGKSHIDCKLIKSLDIRLINKHNKGGSSSARMGRIADNVRIDAVKKISSMIVETYMHDNHTKCKIGKLIMAGPSIMKRDVIDTEIFQKYMNKILFKTINTNDFDSSSAQIIIESILPEMQADDIKIMDEEINNLVLYESENLAFGQFECIEILKENNISKLYVNDIDDDTKEYLLNYQKEKDIKIIFTESQILKLYAGWIGIKKYESCKNEIIE
jgi:peptide subunit release factor 1 (eRF1)